MNALSRTVRMTNKRGLHARASAKFVNLAASLPSAIEVEKDGNKVCGTSIMGLMMLGAAMGDTVVIEVEGESESENESAEDILQTLVKLVEARFGED